LLATGSLALLGAAASCRPSEPTQVPEGGPRGPAPLHERGIRNLLALAELSAAVRWVHPSDEASALVWEPQLLAAVRELEDAEDSEQLAESLREMLTTIAPTVQVWRSAVEAGEELDELACPDPEAEKGPDRARPREDSLTHGAWQSRRPGPPARKTRAKSENADTETGETGDSETGDSETSDSETGDSTSGDSETGDSDTTESSTTGAPEPEPAPEPAPAPKPPLEVQPRPDLPPELLHETDAIVQWRRRGFPIVKNRDRDPPIACAERIVRPADRCVEPSERRRSLASGCARCDEDFELLAPAAPLVLELARGLSAAIPLALWHHGGEIRPPAEFTAEQASAYTLDDRGTRLLAVIQTWSVLRWFSPHQLHDPITPLRRALCDAAESGADAMPAILETLLASFADGNAELLAESPPREFGPAAGFAWVSERAVALPLLDHYEEFEPLRRGDVIVAIAGESIETRLAQALPRASGAIPRARIARAVDRLFVHDQATAKSGLRVEVLRDTGEGETRLELVLDNWLPADERPSGADLRPHESLFELTPGTWYADLGRIPNLRMAARWLRRAESVIVDLRGPMLDERRSLAAHWLSEPLELLDERLLAGPTHEGRLVPLTIEKHRLDPVPARLRLKGRVVVLADHRTRGRAELELVAFDRLGMAIIGSTSAGDSTRTTHFQLPGGLRVRFGQTDMVRHDGTRLSGVGVAPTVAVDPGWPAARERDELVERARILLG
jgi:hypothetical protein